MKLSKKIGVILGVGLLASGALLSSCKKSVIRDIAGGSISAQNTNGGGGTNVVYSSPVRCSITTVFANYWQSNASPTIQFSCIDAQNIALNAPDCQLGNKPWVPCTTSSSHNLVNLVEGPQSFRVRASDASGNTGMSLDLNWGVDVTPPDFSGSAALVSMFNNSPTFTFNATDALSGFLKYQCRLSTSATWEDCVPPKAYPSLVANTAYTFFVRAYDQAGNTNDPAIGVNFTTNPQVASGSCSILSNLPPWSRLSSASLIYSCQNPAGPITAVECRLTGPCTSSGNCAANNGSWASCPTAQALSGQQMISGQQNFTGLGDGMPTFDVRFRDQNNVPSVATTITWKVDTTPPTVNITKADVSTLSPSFSFSGSDSGSGLAPAPYQCQLTSGSTIVADWAYCSSPANYLISAGQNYTFNVKATDNAGNESAVASYGPWLSNPGTGPSCHVTTTFPNGPWRNNNSESINYNCSSVAPIMTRECMLSTNGLPGAWTPCSGLGTDNVTGLTSGSNYQLTVRATDSFGNVGAPSAPLAWSVDLDKPIAHIDSSELDNPTAKFFFSATDQGGSGLNFLECQLDSGPWVHCTSPQTFGGLILNQQYTFNVRATDYAGNVSTVVSKTWTSVPGYHGPICTLALAGTSGADWTNNPSKTFSWSCVAPNGLDHSECSSNGHDFATCVSPTTVTVTASGIQTFYVRGVDPNQKAGPIDQQTWKVDLDKPTVVVTTLSFNSTSTVLTFSPADTGGSGVKKSQCQLDGVSSWADCSSPAVFAAGLDAGASFIFRVHAIDGAGNVSADATQSWTNGGWSPFGACTAACGDSSVTTRTCTNPVPSGDLASIGIGLSCSGNNQKDCPVTACPPPTNGGWGPFGACSKACGGGTQTRTCAEPAPNYVGSTCTKGQTQTQACNSAACCSETDGGELDFGERCKEKTVSCPTGSHRTAERYTKATRQCSWTESNTSATLKCCGEGHHDVDHVFITCCMDGGDNGGASPTPTPSSTPSPSPSIRPSPSPSGDPDDDNRECDPGDCNGASLPIQLCVNHKWRPGPHGARCP